MVPHHNVTVNPENPHPQIGEIIKHVKPAWPNDQLKYKAFEPGLNSTEYGVYLNNPDDMVVVKIFVKDGIIVDRERERKTVTLLASLDLAPMLYATFDNGNVNQFIPGRKLHNSDLRVMEISDLIAQETGRLHAVPVPADYAPGQTRGSFFVELDQMIRKLPKTLDDPKYNETYQKHIANCDLQKEVCELEKMITNLKDNMVIVHHDIVDVNLTLSNDGKRVRFTDFEYAGLDYGSMDIAMHFSGFVNWMEPDPVRFPYPTEEHKRRFITKYLEARYPGKEVTKEALEIWCKRVNAMFAMSFLYGFAWSVLNNYASVGMFAIEEYMKCKGK